jgi:hypothetical protein
MSEHIIHRGEVNKIIGAMIMQNTRIVVVIVMQRV